MKTKLHYFYFIGLLIFSCSCTKKLSSFSNTSNCNCNKYPYSNDIEQFTTTSKNDIVLCAKNVDGIATIAYTINSISNCLNTDSIIIDTSSFYTYHFYQDTLTLYPIVKLPLGLDYKYDYTSIYYYKIFYNSTNKLQKIRVKNTSFPKYTQSQILDIFEEYQLKMAQSDDAVLFLIDKLLMASISGNQLAMKTFRNFEAKYKSMNAIQKAKYKIDKQLLIDFLEL